MTSLPGAIFGSILILVVAIDALETIVLPRTVKRNFRLSLLFYELAGQAFRLAGRLPKSNFRKWLLNAFGPATLLALIVTWALAMVFAFALIVWGVNPHMNDGAPTSFPASLYYSGVTFFTLGFGDLTPKDSAGRILAVTEAGVGFGFLALLIGYVPVIYSSFSRREVAMLLLDSKAGSEPTGTEMLVRHVETDAMDRLEHVLKQWEVVSAELLESMLSYPILAFYRSQHDDSSWLKSLTAVLDCCTLIEHLLIGDEPWMRGLRYQARNTFAMGRHVLVDVAYILDEAPSTTLTGRLSHAECKAIVRRLRSVGLKSKDHTNGSADVDQARLMYEPYCEGLAKNLLVELPCWIHEESRPDNWETSAWEGPEHF